MSRFLQMRWCIVFFVLIWSTGFAFADEARVALLAPDETEAFYASRDGDPYWILDARINEDGRKLLRVLRDSWSHGLNPKVYHVEELEKFGEGDLSDEDALAAELLLTDGYVRYARDMGGMRVKAEELGLFAKDWKQPEDVSAILSRLRDRSGDFKLFLDALEPQTQTYQSLKAEMIRLVSKTSDADDLSPLKFDGLVIPGKGYGDIPKLRARFGSKNVKDNERYTYDDNLVAKIMSFQKEQGLKADGIIGARTLYALNITRKDKIRQLVVNLERLRWVSADRPRRFIVVNIPSAMLWAIDNGQIKYEMPVIVGSVKRPTPSFITKIHGVRFNPTWTVPSTIKKEDIIPKLREDPAYLLDKGMELYDGTGKDARTIDPTTVDWNKMTEEDLQKFHMVQIPGDNNPLGKIRVLMPNPQNIYLHDTNHRTMFDKYDRALSSGCIRMKEPDKIADFILSYRKGWKFENVKKWIDTGETKDIYVDEMMPVYLLYYTAWVDVKGHIIYGMDIYQNDKKLLQALEKLDGFVI